MTLGRSLLATAAALGGPALFFMGFRQMRIRQLIAHTPTARIRSMAMGLVELSGEVAARSRITAPFSRREVAYWEVQVQTLRASRKGQRAWTTVHRAHSGSPFYLSDGSGRALVFPDGADVRTSMGVEEQTNGFGVPQMYMDYMERAGLALRAVWALGPMRFRERVLAEGQHVYVLGRAHPKPMAHTVSEIEEDVLEATGTDAWSARRLRAHDAEVQGVIRRTSGDPCFLISPSSEKSMSAEYAVRAFGGLIGGPIATLFGVWCLLELARSGQLFR